MPETERLVLWSNGNLRVVAVKRDGMEKPEFRFEEGRANAKGELVYSRARMDSFTLRDQVLDAIMSMVHEAMTEAAKKEP